MKKTIFNRVLRALALLLIAGFMIGLLHQQDIIVALFLLLGLVYKLIVEIKKSTTPKIASIFIIGTIMTGLLGALAEVWGIYNGYWTYHNLPNGREFPYWLPIAWAFTFIYFYRIEEFLFAQKQVKSKKSKILILVFIYAVFPALGEIVVINMGVWTYRWPYQFFGVPLLAIFLLVVFHILIYFIFSFVLINKKIENPVFNFNLLLNNN